MMGITDWVAGDFAAAVAHLKCVAELYAPRTGNTTDLRYSQDHAVWSLSLLALSLWPLGYVDQAINAATKSLERAEAIDHAMTMGFALIFGSLLCECIGADSLRGGRLYDQALHYCVKKDLRAYFPWSRFYAGLSRVKQGERQEGLDMMRDAMAAANKIHTKLLWTPHLGLLASAHALAGEMEAASTLLREAFETVAESGERMFEPELHRLHGELLFRTRRYSEAEAEFARALEIARGQNAKSWELRAAMSLARLRAHSGKLAEAREVLAPVYSWFTEGLETPDLKQARLLLEGLQ
jgi:predicted ATPase